MAKYVIEVNTENPYKDKYCGVAYDSSVGLIGQNTLDELPELTAKYVNEHFGSLQNGAYNKGLEDAWELARKIYEDLTIVDVKKAFGKTAEFSELLSTLTPHEALAKLQAYEQKQKEDEIKVGDEITPTSEDSNWKGVVVSVEDESAMVMDNAGYTANYPFDIIKRTGRHFTEVAQLLGKMKGE